MCRRIRPRSIRAHGVAMTAPEMLVLLLCAGLALRSATRLRQIRRAELVESPRARNEPPVSSGHEAAHPYCPPGRFDRRLMVEMLLNEGHITEMQAVELLEGEL